MHKISVIFSSPRVFWVQQIAEHSNKIKTLRSYYVAYVLDYWFKERTKTKNKKQS